MNIELKNCNSIDKANINIKEGRLNIKYAINGTGKSTISRALAIATNLDKYSLEELKPFKYLQEEGTENNPQISGVQPETKIAVFNEEYVNQYVFLEDEIIKNSFDIFVKTKDYEKHMREIDILVSGIKELFTNNPELNSLLQDMIEFIDGFGKTKTGYSSTGAIGKSLGKGNKLNNIPLGLEEYTEFLKNDQNIKWLKWQIEGKNYLEISDKCPYCTTVVEEKKEMITKISEEYDSKIIEQLNKILDLFDRLGMYFSSETNGKVKEIANNIDGLSKEQIAYLKEIKEQAELLREKLEKIKYIGFNSLKDVDKIVEELGKYKIDISYLSHLNTLYTEEKIEVINSEIDHILQTASKLQGEINQQKKAIQKTIKKYSVEINDFLKYAGYNYNVSISEENDNTYKMKLKHNDIDKVIDKVKTHLSYGERNAFALVLFMYNSIHENPDLVILDDPISSFDSNKKFAILNMLFMGNECLRGKTVIMFTHDFEPVIDAIYNMPYNFNPSPTASFLENVNGTIVELEICKVDIQSCVNMARQNIMNLSNTTNKLIYLRRLIEVENVKGNGWQLLSNLFHKDREQPLIRESDESERLMSSEEICEGSNEIRKYISEFDYQNEYQIMHNRSEMIDLYKLTNNSYEKLQIYRVINDDNSDNKVVKKFINETFHIENDYLFQLNPCKYNVIPGYIINECDADIELLISLSN